MASSRSKAETGWVKEPPAWRFARPPTLRPQPEPVMRPQRASRTEPADEPDERATIEHDDAGYQPPVPGEAVHFHGAGSARHQDRDERWAATALPAAVRDGGHHHRHLLYGQLHRHRSLQRR